MAAFNGNFEPEVRLVGRTVQLLGQSTQLEGGKLVSRHVVLQQPDRPVATARTQIIDGPSEGLGTAWDAKLDMDAAHELGEKEFSFAKGEPDFKPGPALAVATETYVLPAPLAPGATAAFVTHTWSEPVDIVTATDFAPVADDGVIELPD
jgi:hypothetical protein